MRTKLLSGANCLLVTLKLYQYKIQKHSLNSDHYIHNREWQTINNSDHLNFLPKCSVRRGRGKRYETFHKKGQHDSSQQNNRSLIVSGSERNIILPYVFKDSLTLWSIQETAYFLVGLEVCIEVDVFEDKFLHANRLRLLYIYTGNLLQVALPV